MSQQDMPNAMDPFEPWRRLREMNVQVWVNMMADPVCSDALTRVMSSFLDTYLAASAPFQNIIDQYMNAAFPRLNLSSRNDLVDLSERLVGLEQRLDDLEATMEQQMQGITRQLIQATTRSAETDAGTGAPAGHLQALHDNIAELRQMVEALTTGQTVSAPATTGRRRRGNGAA